MSTTGIPSISFGMTTRPSSSMRLTMPVAYIYIPPAVVSFSVAVVFAGKSEIYTNAAMGQSANKKTEPFSSVDFS